MRILLVVTCLLSTAAHASPGASPGVSPGASPGASPEVPQDVIDARHAAAIRAAATGFADWGRVDEAPNLAPFLCRSPTPADHGAPSHVRMSAAERGPHGKKLYYLWASDKPTYLQRDHAIPVGFSIVKEAFAAVAFDEAHPPKDPHADAVSRHVAPPPTITWMVTADGDKLATGERKDLFVMTKVGDVPGADAGWVYGTVAPDGTVTSAGKVASCMGCHVGHATHERLFGLPAAPRSSPTP